MTQDMVYHCSYPMNKNYVVTTCIIFTWTFGGVVMVTTFSQSRIRCDQTKLCVPTGLLDYKLVMGTVFFSLKKNEVCYHSRYSRYHIRLVNLGSSSGFSTNMYMTLGWSLNISGFIFFTYKMRGME